MNTMTELRKTIEAREIILQGINADLVAWWRGATLAAQAFRDIPGADDLLFLALGAQPESERIRASGTLIEHLWYAHPALGPYPFLETLSRFEFDRVFYPDYRDHVTHQLKVYLLGLCAYDGCPRLRTAVDGELSLGDEASRRREFLLRWLIAAVFHDIGYVLENRQAEESAGSAWQKTAEEMSCILAAPISRLRPFQRDFAREMEERVIQEHGIFVPSVKHTRDIERDTDTKTDLFALLREPGIRAGLGPDKSVFVPIRAYYEYAFAHSPAKSGRPRFRDHGVASALLLLKTWRTFAAHVRRLAALDGEPLLATILQPLRNLRDALAAHEAAVVAAAGAISLHNVTNEIWDAGDALTYDLTLSTFRIHLDGPGAGPTLRTTALAFLLAFVDTLQGWDRPLYRAPRMDDIAPRAAPDLSLSARNGRLHLYFPADALRFKTPASDSASCFSQVRAALRAYLQESAVNDLLRWDDQSPGTTAFPPEEPALLRPVVAPPAGASTKVLTVWVDSRRRAGEEQLSFGITGERPITPLQPKPGEDADHGDSAKRPLPESGNAGARGHEGGRGMIGGVLECGELLGKGGMGEVYRAHHCLLNLDVAVKFPRAEFLRDEAAQRRFRREAKLARSLVHPNIVRIHDFGEDPAWGLYIQMELVEGTTLRWLLQDGPVSLGRALSIGRSMLDALAYAHEKHVLHLDVKPENILIARDGTVKLVDFGLARALRANNLDLRVQRLGTAYYVAPEILRGEEVDERADVFSAGAILYEMLTGAPPMGSLEPLPEGLPARIREAILDAIRPRRQGRPPSVDAFLVRLGEMEVAPQSLQTAAELPTKPLRDRVLYLEGLARRNGGDPRLVEERWVHIPAGKVSVRGETINVESFDIAWAPVTVQEYRDFVEAADRLEARWWAGTPKPERKNILDDHLEDWWQQLDHPNCPVVSVTWWEATAYCRWRAAQRHDGRVVRLPTEAEWQWAAEGPERRPYPWGMEAPGVGDLARANWEPAGIRHRTPVGVFPGGNCGEIVDLAGNVWEWCDLLHGTDTACAGLSGGSWIDDDPSHLRSGYRSLTRRGCRNGRIGFRLVRPTSTVSPHSRGTNPRAAATDPRRVGRASPRRAWP